MHLRFFFLCFVVVVAECNCHSGTYFEITEILWLSFHNKVPFVWRSLLLDFVHSSRCVVAAAKEVFAIIFHSISLHTDLENGQQLQKGKRIMPFFVCVSVTNLLSYFLGRPKDEQANESTEFSSCHTTTGISPSDNNGNNFAGYEGVENSCTAPSDSSWSSFILSCSSPFWNRLSSTSSSSSTCPNYI